MIAKNEIVIKVFHGFIQSFQANAGMPHLGADCFSPNSFQFMIYRTSKLMTECVLDMDSVMKHSTNKIVNLIFLYSVLMNI
jgi:hypothetical protein